MAALIQALIFLLLIRSASPEDFGFFSAAFGVVTVAQTLFDFGLPTYVTRERARNPGSKSVASALRLNNILSLAMATVLLAGTAALGMTVDPRFYALLPLGVWAAAERNADAWLGVLIADGDAKVNTFNLVARRLGNLVFFLLFYAVLDVHPVLAFGLSSAVAATLSWAFAHIYVKRRLPSSGTDRAITLIREAWPFWVNSVATQARNLDATLVGLVAGAGQAGFFGAAARLMSPLRILPTSLAVVILPVASRRDSGSLGPLLRLVAAVVAALTLVYVLLAVFIPAGVPLILGEAYVGAVPALQITVVGLVFASAASLLGAILQGVGLKHFVAGTAVATTSVCLVGVCIGAFWMGATGAAIGLASSYLIQSSSLLSRILMFVARKEANR